MGRCAPSFLFFFSWDHAHKWTAHWKTSLAIAHRGHAGNGLFRNAVGFCERRLDLFGELFVIRAVQLAQDHDKGDEHKRHYGQPPAGVYHEDEDHGGLGGGVVTCVCVCVCLRVQMRHNVRHCTWSLHTCVIERKSTFMLRHIWSDTVVVSAASLLVISPVRVVSKKPTSCPSSAANSCLRSRMLRRVMATVKLPPRIPVKTAHTVADSSRHT